MKSQQIQLEEKIRLYIEKGRDMVDINIGELEQGALRIAGDSDMADFMRLSPPLDQSHYYSLLRMGEEFQNFDLKKNFASESYLIFKKSGSLISNKFYSPDMAFFYPEFLKYNNLSYDEWVTDFELWSDKKGYYPFGEIKSSIEENQWAMSIKIPVPNGISQPNAVLLILIPSENLDGFFREILEKKGILTILSDEGVEIYQSHIRGDVPLKTKEFIISSPQTGLTYHVTLPLNFFKSETRSIRLLFLTALSGIVLTGLLTSLFFTRRNTKPYLPLFSLLEEEKNTEPFHKDYITHSVEKLMGERVNIKEELLIQKRMLLNSFYERLIRGGFSSEETIRDNLKSLEISFSSKKYKVVLIKGNQREMIPIIVQGIFEKNSYINWHRYNTREGMIFLIPEDRENTKKIKEIQRLLLEDFSIITIAASGLPKHKVILLENSFSEALMAAQCSPEPNEVPLCIEFSNREDDIILFSEKDRQDIIRLVMGGNREEIIPWIELIKLRFLETKTSTEIYLKYFREMEVIAEHISDQIIDWKSSPDYYSFTSLDDFFTKIGNLFLKMAEIKQEAKKSHNEKLIGNILSFLEKHYNDSQICLDSLSKKYGLNPQYLSRFFKEQTGEGFSSLLERIRMEKALSLIQLEDLKTKDIGSMVGYLSPNSFYKAFRRYYGIAPGDLKRNKNVS